MICSRCKKRPAIIYVQRIENGETKNEGLCWSCAKELGMPQISSMLENMGITEDEFDAMSNQLMEMTDGDSFELGGAETMPNFLQNIFGGEKPVPISESSQDNKKNADGKKNGKEQKRQPLKFLDSYCTNLCEKAREGKLDRIVGRDKEIYRVTQILSRRTKNNPCLIGEPGVGKTAIAEGIAQRIVSEEVPFRLLDKEVFLLDMTSLVAGTQFRGQFESRVKGLIDEVKTLGNVILFIDEVHTLVGTGDSEGSMSAANIMKPALSRGEIQVIGATTFNEYRKHIEKDSALERRFQPVTVVEPSIDESIDVLRGIKVYYEFHHKVKVSDEIIKLAVIWSERYINDRFLPDKAIDLLDEACACASIKSTVLTEYAKQNAKLKMLSDEEKGFEENTQKAEPDFEKIATLKAQISQVKEELKKLEPQISDIQVTVDDVAKVIELTTGIPSSKIEQNDYQKIIHLEDDLKKHIIGQDDAVNSVALAIKRNRLQLSSKKRPASFIFVGPTGVGKTELVKVLSSALFDSVDPIVRFDMSEFMEKHAVSRLVGSPPGYVGYDEAGQLTEKVRRKPYSVVLFDEIEKAHPDVMNILLQILDEGKVTDAHGRDVNFENTVIVMTSNAGSNDKVGIVGFNKSTGEIAKEKALKALSDFLRPEFLGRVDEVVVFNPLSHDTLSKIADLALCDLEKALLEKNIKLAFDNTVCEWIASHADGEKSNARDIHKVIRKEVEDRLAQLLIENFDKKITAVQVVIADEKLTLISL